MIVEHYTSLLGQFWYVTAPGCKHQPGYLNGVKIVFHEDGHFEANYTDGYKLQYLGWYPSRELALAAAAHAIENGAGGGFTSYFRPCTTGV